MVWPNGKVLKHGKCTYTIQKQLKREGEITTYLVEDQNTNTFVLKTLSDPLLASPDTIILKNRLLEEILALEKCNNSHIVKLKDRFESNENVLCIVLDCITGRHLSELPKSDLPLSEQRALSYISQLGEALIELHHHKLIHRDLKPNNIVLQAGENKLMIVDFGLVRKFDHPLTSQTNISRESEGFASPEMYPDARGTNCGDYTDVYSLAAILYFLLTGNIPPSYHERKGAEDKLQENLNELSEQNKISLNIKEVILKGMEIKIDKRYKSVESWLKLLDENDNNSNDIGNNKIPLRIPDTRIQTICAIIAVMLTLLGIIITITLHFIPRSNNQLEKIEKSHN